MQGFTARCQQLCAATAVDVKKELLNSFIPGDACATAQARTEEFVVCKCIKSTTFLLLFPQIYFFY